MELRTSREIMPVVEINYQELKTSLTAEMQKYKGIIVTDETLKDCKATQKELAGLKRNIDDYRKQKKKQLSAPIVAFENECKELIKIIEQVEKPIKEGIAVYDDAKRQEKRKIAEQIAEELIRENALITKYADMVEIKPNYMNVTTTQKAIREDIQAQINMLKAQQIAEEEKIKVVGVAIENANKRLNRKIKISEFERYLNMELSEILNEVDKMAQAIYEAENPEPVQLEPEVTAPEVVAPAEPEITAPETSIKSYSLTLTGDASVIEMFIDKMDRNGIDVEIEGII